MLARIEGPDLEPLPFVVHDVSVVVAGHRARVVFDMVFENPSRQTLAGTLMIGLPDRASPCYLATFDGKGRPGARGAARARPGAPRMRCSPLPIALQTRWKDVDWGKERSARVVEPVRGREVYEAVTRRRVDPALAEWAGSGTFSARIYPIAPSGRKRVVFAYDQTLPLSGGKVAFALPEPAPAAALRRITVHEVGGLFGRAALSAGGGGARCGAGGRQPHLAARPRRGAAGGPSLRGEPCGRPRLSVLAGADPAVPGTLATLLVTPELPPRSLVASTGRALFVLDTSYSGRDALYALSGQMLRRILETDDSIGEFAILAFDVRAELLTPGFVPNTRDVREGALADVERVRLEGATSFASVVDALNGQPDLLRAATFFLLSDGEITWGPDDPRELASGAQPRTSRPGAGSATSSARRRTTSGSSPSSRAPTGRSCGSGPRRTSAKRRARTARP